MGPKNIRAKGGLGFFRKWRKSAIVRPAKIFPSETPTFELHSLDRPGSIGPRRSEEHTSELQSLMRISYAVFCLKKKILPHINLRHSSPSHIRYFSHTIR